jgi:hypothetical protein
MIALLVVGAMASAFAGNVTVGRFYTQLAQAKHLAAADAATAEASLRGAGFNLPRLALDKSLTEGDMTAISTTLGLTVTTERPTQMISEAQLNTFMSSFGGQIGVSKTQPINPFETLGSKGKKKGHHKSAVEPI